MRAVSAVARRFVADVARARGHEAAASVVVLVFVAPLLLLVAAGAIVGSLAGVRDGHPTAVTAGVAIGGFLLSWCAATARLSLAQLLGTRSAARVRGRDAVMVLRVGVGFAVLVAEGVLLGASADTHDEHLAVAVAVGLVGSLVFAGALPRMVRSARAAWAAWRLVRTAERRALSSLRPGSRVRTRGRIVEASALVPGFASQVVYHHRRCEPYVGAFAVRTSSFLVEDAGARAWVDADADTVADGRPCHGSHDVLDEAVFAVGDLVEIVGTVAGTGGALYREGTPRLGAGDGVLVILSDKSRTPAALGVASVVEWVTAATYALAPLLVVATAIYAALVAE